MLQRVDDARAQIAGNLRDDLRPEVAPHGVAAERQRKAGVLLPPGAQIGPEVEALVGVGELALVDQQPDLDLAPVDRVLDLVEGIPLR